MRSPVGITLALVTSGHNTYCDVLIRHWAMPDFKLTMSD